MSKPSGPSPGSPPIMFCGPGAAEARGPEREEPMIRESGMGPRPGWAQDQESDEAPSQKTVCKVLIEQKKDLYRWYYTDQELCAWNIDRLYNGGKLYSDLLDPKTSEARFLKDILPVPGIVHVRISRYALSIQLANSLFSFQDIEPQILKAIEEALEMQVQVVREDREDIKPYEPKPDEGLIDHF